MVFLQIYVICTYGARKSGIFIKNSYSTLTVNVSGYFLVNRQSCLRLASPGSFLSCSSVMYLLLRSLSQDKNHLEICGLSVYKNLGTGS